MSNMINAYNIFIFLQCNFNKKMSDDIFGDLSEHLFEKWLNCNYNIINFLSMLDNGNKQLILNYGEDMMKNQ